MLPMAEASGNPLDDCTLQNMAGVTSDAAAKFIREACLGKISSNIPIEKLKIESKGAFGKDQYSSSTAFYLSMEDNSPYAITELMIRITSGAKSNEYRVTRFLAIYTGPGIMTALPPDPASYLQIKPFSTIYFSFPVREEVPNKNDKWSYGVISAKGYLAASD